MSLIVAEAKGDILPYGSFGLNIPGERPGAVARIFRIGGIRERSTRKIDILQSDRPARVRAGQEVDHARLIVGKVLGEQRNMAVDQPGAGAEDRLRSSGME